jgi:hypothetical protein
VLIFRAEDVDRVFLQSVGICLHVHTTLLPRTTTLPSSPSWDLKSRVFNYVVTFPVRPIPRNGLSPQFRVLRQLIIQADCSKYYCTRWKRDQASARICRAGLLTGGPRVACGSRCHFMRPAVRSLECGWYIRLDVCWENERSWVILDLHLNSLHNNCLRSFTL